jgi:hypothetical protein
MKGLIMTVAVRKNTLTATSGRGLGTAIRRRPRHARCKPSRAGSKCHEVSPFKSTAVMMVNGNQGTESFSPDNPRFLGLTSNFIRKLEVNGLY